MLRTRVLNCVKSDTIIPKNGVARIELADEGVFTLVGKLERVRATKE